MRIVVDAHMAGKGETGNETYVVNLVSNLAQLPNMRCAAAVMPEAKLPAPLQKGDVEILSLSSSRNWMRLIHALPTLCKNWRADLLHVTYTGPFFTSCPLVVSVHDISFKHYPEFFSPRDRLLFATLLPLTLRRASAVITISEYSKQKILDSFPFLNGKMYVTLLAPNTLFQPVREGELLQAIRTRYGIHSRFILAVGNLQPRKNLLRLISAFATIRRQIDLVQLVIVGKDQWQSSKIYARVKQLNVEDDVIFTGYVSDEDLMLLYNAADVYVYPSIYEGFGLPILEAMACGTPVVTSNTTSMPEVAGDAALLVDPFQEDQIVYAIQRILTESDLALSLSNKGLERVRQFSWQKTAQQTVAIYQLILNQNKGR